MNKYVIDTNFFVNMEIKSGFGLTSKDVISEFVPLANTLIQNKKAQFFIPPRINDEMLTFFEEQPFFKGLQAVLTVKSPVITDISFNASVFYQLVEEIRERSYKGLRIAEESLDQATKMMLTMENADRKTFQQSLQDPIKRLRDRYRQATRFNFLDSVADLDLIVLTKELDGMLVSSDEGVIRWGRIFGVKEVAPQNFKDLLLSL